MSIHSLAFDPNARRLAVGITGDVRIWDRSAGDMKSLLGLEYDVSALAFSSDGTMLATGGRGSVHVWDAATCRHLVAMPGGDYVSHVAFAQDGDRLVICSRDAGVSVWSIRNGNGFTTFRGSRAIAALACFSPDGRRLAALAHDWTIGVWDVATGKLLHRFDAPIGRTSDNAAIAFAPSGEKMAFATGERACLWDLRTGAKERSWDLPPGLVDQLHYQSDTELFLLRLETRNGQPPLSEFPFQQYPRVCRLRNLFAADPTKACLTIDEFNRRVFDARIARDGSFVVVEGLTDGPGGARRAVIAYDRSTGQVRWKLDVPRKGSTGALIPDQSGQYFAHSRFDDQHESTLIDANSGADRVTLPTLPFRTAVNSGWAAYGFHTDESDAFGLQLVTIPEATSLVVLGLDQAQLGAIQFSPDGRSLVWANRDGTLSMCRLDLLRSELMKLGLAW
jgi:WD40 repeat protein